MPKRDNDKYFKVWIELPRHNDDAVNEKRAEMCNKMLQRLVGGDPKDYGFFWNKHEQLYCVNQGGGTYLTCSDHGHWFNLEVLTQGPIQ